MWTNIRAFALVVCPAVMIAGPAAAWDYAGHRIVGAIADIVLQEHFENTYKRVRDVLKQRTLSEVAVFPDCAKNEEEFCGRKPSPEEIEYVFRNLVHKSFHYTNSPLGQATYLPTGFGAGPTDVVQMLRHVTIQLKTNKPPFKPDVRLTESEALWLLAHLVGDIHQPLHVGQPYYGSDCNTWINPNNPADKDKEANPTAGGNSIKFMLSKPAVPVVPGLHIYWDAVTVANAMRAQSYADLEKPYAKMLAEKTPPAGWETTGDPETWAEKWFAESMALAQQVYSPPGIQITGTRPSASGSCRWSVTLDKGYEERAQEIAREQLRKAGFRLAALLVAIFPN